MIPAELTMLLRSRTFPCSTEATLQESIGLALREWRIPFDREYKLGPGERVDFFTHSGIGIEAKVTGQARSIFRQLERYAKHSEVLALILITGRAMGLPASINGKPLFYVSLGRSAL